MAHAENDGGGIFYENEAPPALRTLSPHLLHIPALLSVGANAGPSLVIRQRRNTGEPIVKILMTGDHGVGKSSMMRRFNDGVFQADGHATIGIDFVMKRVEQAGQDAAIAQVWDTAGGERFRSISAAYYRGCHVCLLMFDISRRDSFSALARHADECHRNAHPATVTCVVACKGDLAHNRQVSHEEIQHFCQEAGVHGYCEASALTGEGVNELFEEATRAAVTRFPLQPPEDNPILLTGPPQARPCAC